jgi:LemA protein
MKSRMGLWVVLGIIIILVFWGCNSYNSLVGVDQDVKKAWGSVETNYQRRTDLYNAVIKTISASANFEKSTLREVIEARSRASAVRVDLEDSASLRQFQQAQAQLQSSFSRLLAVAEAYPQLQTTTAFREFQAQQEGTENRINIARQNYNASVENYNLRVKRFPGSIFASIFGYREKAFYRSNPGSENLPDMDFNIQ